MPALKVESIYKSFGSLDVLSDITFDLEDSKRLAVVGASGSGKSTLLRIIAGLETPDSGSIQLNNTVIVSKDKFIKPEKRNIGFVFQDNALFPHLNILQNLVFGIKNKSREEKNKIAVKHLELIGLTEKIKSYPHELSGGERQRISLVRALCCKPKLLLLDEPFSDLDGHTKSLLKNDIKKLLELEDLTTIMITHDPEDSFDLCHEVLLLDGGRIISKGKPEELYLNPINIKAAKYFSSTNVIERSEHNSRFFEHFNIKSDVVSISPTAVSVNESGIEAMVKNIKFTGLGYLIMIECLGAEFEVYTSEVIPSGRTISINIKKDKIASLD